MKKKTRIKNGDPNANTINLTLLFLALPPSQYYNTEPLPLHESLSGVGIYSIPYILLLVSQRDLRVQTPSR